MGRTPSDNPKKHQVLARLTAAEMEVLTAIAHLEGTTPNGLVRRLVEQEIRRMEADQHVRADIANRRAYTKKKEGAVVPLAAGRRRRSKSSG